MVMHQTFFDSNFKVRDFPRKYHFYKAVKLPGFVLEVFFFIGTVQNYSGREGTKLYVLLLNKTGPSQKSSVLSWDTSTWLKENVTTSPKIDKKQQQHWINAI